MSKKQMFSTPKGTAKYPWLNRPSTKFNPEGVYTVNLLLPAEDPATQALMEKLDGLVEAAYKTHCSTAKLNKAQAKAVKTQTPYTVVEDEDGNPTGEVEFKFKMKAKITSKKTGKTYEMAPALFDAKNKPFDVSKSIFGGSTIKVGFSLQGQFVIDGDLGNYYYMATSKTVGLSLQLEAVQVIKLASSNNSASGSSFGFEAEEGDDVGTEEDAFDGNEEDNDTSEEGEDF